jgi:hypothetical protein
MLPTADRELSVLKLNEEAKAEISQSPLWIDKTTV